MVSVESVKNSIADARGDLLLLMQEGDSEVGFTSPEWADEMYLAWTAAGAALKAIERAQDLEE